ncbi:hypothetical protein L1787_18385 [Acuticoccus sp. M5D2P5]|uniref:tetratricopeptide repeat protein n=1 Tax=Acuticoccus kalidii TaxID=2910977 RepID=UPI001F1AA315|nr:hypothetical protein [Acuticoccus kalidii]MCF3935366.1 hypothetical protein [Acuticoccus kalidii]
MRPVSVAIGEGPRHPGPSPNDIREELDRLLSHPRLDASERRRAFLRYIVEETLDGRSDRLKGYTIAVSVFGRDETFDSSADPVVRLEARRLRRDLDSYYLDAGHHDPVRISIPKGGYVPNFEWHARPEPRPSAPLEVPESALAGEPLPVADATALPAPLAEPDTAPVTQVPAPLEPATSDAAPAAPSRRLHVMVFLAAAAVAIFGLAMLATALWLVFGETKPPIGTGEPAVVVLPFKAFGRTEDGPILAEGISNELIGHLMQFPGFRVYVRPVAQPLANGSPAALGRDLGVAYVVDGRVGIEAEHARLTAQLYDARTGEVIWATTYDRPFTTEALMGLQRDLAGELATALAQPYGIVNKAAQLHTSPATASMSSYLCVMQAYTYRRTFARRAFAPALACLEEAVARDPSYPDALAMLGWLYLDAGRFEFADGVPQDESYVRALDVAARALALDPHNSLALKAIAAINHYMGRFREGERFSREAVARNPYDPDALAQLGWRLAVRGNFEEGIPLLERAIARSVDPPGWYNHLIAIDLYLRGDYQEMLSLAERSAAPGLGIGEALIAIAAGALDMPERTAEALADLSEYGPLSRDPSAYFRRHGANDEIVEALSRGLQHAEAVAARP